ncbi:copper resistance CopC family protein [Micromonospora sp. DT31]|uniref:copper resistance CopC family protein n=1 Tax=Micromonospora sp. DT31 TaxID=3393434 RepID=UPI003CF576E1
MGGRVDRATRTWLVLLGVVAGATLLPAAPAAAHNSLTGSEPRDGARLAAAPQRIELRFLATPKEATTTVTVTGPDNAAATAGAPTFSGKRVSVPFRAGPAGLYTVTYRLASDDGHPVKGEVRFTLTTGTTASPAATPTGAAPTPAPTSAAPAPANPSSAAGQGDDDAGTGWWWAGGAVVALAVLGGAVLLRRRAAPT